MNSIKVSAKYQIVIPREIRESMGIRPGQALQMFESGGRIEIVPVRAARDMRGRFPGLNTTVERDGGRV